MFLSASYQKLRLFLSRFLPIPPERLYATPFLPLVYFLLALAFPGCLASLYPGQEKLFLMLAAGLPILGLLLFSGSRQLYLSVLLLGTISCCLRTFSGPRDYRRFIPRIPASVEIEAVVIEDRMPLDAAEEIPQRLKSVRVSLRKIRSNSSEDWQSCHGTILLRNPTTACVYGTRLRISGRLEKPWTGGIPGGFNYRRYLRIRGIFHVLYPISIKKLQPAADLSIKLGRELQRLRTRLWRQLKSHIPDPDNQNILAAMTLGFRRGMPPEQRQIYLRSGMVHLFAISGLHVGILGSILLLALLLGGVPFSIRYFTAPLLLLAYVLLSGSAPSAIRAWMMFAVWSVGRGLRRPASSTNAVAAAAFFLLLWNPYYLFQSGFQFSFVIVLCLIWGWRRSERLLRLLDERRFWVPSRHRNEALGLRRFFRPLARAMAGMICAWLGGIALSMHYNALFLPTSMVSNLLVCSLAWLILALAVVKTAAGLILFGLADPLLGWILSQLLSGLGQLATASATYGGAMTTVAPGPLPVSLYYLLLAAFLWPGLPLRRRFAHGLFLFGFCLWLILGMPPRPLIPRITVFLPSGTMVPVVVMRMATHPAEPLILNTGRPFFGNSLSGWLRRHGISRIDTILLPDNRAAFISGYAKLTNGIPARQTFLFARDGRNLTDLRRAQWRNGGSLKIVNAACGRPTPQLFFTRNNEDKEGQKKYSLIIHSLLPQENTLRIQLWVIPGNTCRLRIEDYTKTRQKPPRLLFDQTFSRSPSDRLFRIEASSFFMNEY